MFSDAGNSFSELNT